MASTPDVNLWADVTLDSTELLLEDIHDRAPDWDERPEDERVDIFLEWEALMNRLEGVIEDDRAGALTQEQQRRLRELVKKLDRSHHVIVRLGLDYPELGHLSLA